MRPMFTENPRYRWFGDNDRHFRRTIADAIEVLFSIPTFTAQSHATVRVAPLCLPSKKTVGLVNVEFDGPLPEITSVVAMPTCAHFRGVQASSQQQKCYDIFRLDQATIDATHRVRLADGTCLCAVELLPAQLPLEPSELDWRIVWLAIAFLGAEKKCCPSLSWTCDSSAWVARNIDPRTVYEVGYATRRNCGTEKPQLPQRCRSGRANFGAQQATHTRAGAAPRQPRRQTERRRQLQLEIRRISESQGAVSPVPG